MRLVYIFAWRFFLMVSRRLVMVRSLSEASFAYGYTLRVFRLKIRYLRLSTALLNDSLFSSTTSSKSIYSRGIVSP